MPPSVTGATTHDEIARVKRVCCFFFRFMAVISPFTFPARSLVVPVQTMLFLDVSHVEFCRATVAIMCFGKILSPSWQLLYRTCFFSNRRNSTSLVSLPLSDLVTRVVSSFKFQLLPLPPPPHSNNANLLSQTTSLNTAIT